MPQFQLNPIRIWIVITVFSGILLFLGYQFGERLGLVLTFLLSLGACLVLFLFGDSHILRQLSAAPIRGRDPWGIGKIAEKYTRQLQLHKGPALYQIPGSDPIVFGVVQSWRQIAFCFSEGLLHSLNLQERELLFTLLLAHTKRLEKFRFLFFSLFFNGFFGLLGLRWKGARSFFQNISHLYLTRSAIMDADRLAGKLSPSSYELGRLLLKLQAYSERSPFQMPAGSEYILLAHPQMRPKMSERVQKLVGFYPL